MGVLICWDNNLVEKTGCGNRTAGAEVLLAPHQTGERIHVAHTS
ncbi:hypothetical protein AB6846_05845 [Serratia proteamaculans]